MLNLKVVGIVEVIETLTTLENESGLQIQVQTNNLAHVMKVEVTEDRIAEMLPLNLFLGL